MNVIIRPRGGVKFEAETRGHVLISDQPASNKGEDTGMTPPELLLASLGTCMAYYGLEYLRTRSLPADSFEISVDAEKVKSPARIGKFEVRVKIPELNEQHRAGIERAMKNCLIHHTMQHAPELNLSLEEPVGA